MLSVKRRALSSKVIAKVSIKEIKEKLQQEKGESSKMKNSLVQKYFSYHHSPNSFKFFGKTTLFTSPMSFKYIYL